MKKITGRILVTVVILCVFEVHGDCILSGKCVKNDAFVTIVKHPPKKGELNDKALAILQKRCPDLYDGSMSNFFILYVVT